MMFAKPISLVLGAAALAAAAPTRRSTCSQPAGSKQYSCDDVWHPTDNSGWKFKVDEWQGTEPGVFADTNVAWTDGAMEMSVLDKGADWHDPSVSDTCDCGYKQYSTALAVSEETYGYGYYEAKIQGGTPYHLGFWLQGDGLEINVVEFSQDKFYSNYHCFSSTDETGEDTKSGEAKDYDAPGAGEWVTYGVEYTAAALKFYRNGVLHDTASPECLGGVADKLNVGFTHETNPDFGDIATGDAKVAIKDFMYWTDADVAQGTTTEQPTTATESAFVPTCGQTVDGDDDSAYTCSKSHMYSTQLLELDASKAAATTVDDATCCKVSVCSQITGTYSKDGVDYDMSKLYYGGALIKVPDQAKGVDSTIMRNDVQKKFSPDGKAWKWFECAAECAKNPECKYWYIPKKTLGCILRKGKSAAPNGASLKGGQFASVAHGDANAACDGYRPEAACRANPDGCDKCSTIEDTSGYFGGGKAVATLKKTKAPNGRVWAWHQCAGECSKEATCKYWFIHKLNGACYLRDQKAGKINDKGVTAHGMRSADGACPGYSRHASKCTQDCGAETGLHGGAKLKSFARKFSPAAQGFAWYECAGKCTEHNNAEKAKAAPGALCAYWYVSKDKVCVLRKAKAGKTGSFARAHGVASECDGYCPSGNCDSEWPREEKGKWVPNKDIMVGGKNKNTPRAECQQP